MERKQPTIETERLLLRPWRIEDAEDMYAYARDPQVGPNAGWKPHDNVEESRQIVSRWIEDPDELEFALEYKETGRVIGSVGIMADGRRPNVPGVKNLGYVLRAKYWGSGLMTEAATAAIDYAFQTMKVELLTINHYPDNARSRRVIEKCGFHYDGTLRRATAIYNGAVRDLCCYSMTPAEYWLLQAKKRGLSLALPEEVPLEDIAAYQAEWGIGKMVPGALAKKEGQSLEQWLESNIAGRIWKADPLHVTAHTWFLVNEQKELLGGADLRHCLNEGLLRTGGHIGYGLRPSCRGKRYAPCMLALVLEKAKERGIRQALVTCTEENRASAATIEACGGVLENKVFEEEQLFRRYWITI